MKVSGESNISGFPFKEADCLNPEDDYAKSKAEAEKALLDISEQSSMEIVIIRPPLVYGPGVKANFYDLLKLSTTKLPLPFGCVNNKRSVIYIENLVDVIVECATHPAAANQIFFVSDSESISISGLIKKIRLSIGRAVWLLPAPVFILRFLGLCFGKSKQVNRLVDDLLVDSSKVKKLLHWTPPYTVSEGIQVTVEHFLAEK